MIKGVMYSAIVGLCLYAWWAFPDLSLFAAVWFMLLLSGVINEMLNEDPEDIN